MKIAVISDTHGLLRPEVMEIIDSCDAVIHGGDINSPEIVEELSKRCPLYVVRGNNDKEWAEGIPLTRAFELEGVRFFAVHNKKDVPEDLGRTDVVIFGHSHKYFEEITEGKLWLNPGSCGRRRFHQPITMAVMDVEKGTYKVNRVDISHKEEKPNKKGQESSDMSGTIRKIMRGFAKGETVDSMAAKLEAEPDFVDEICRIIATHPGVDADGILNKIEVNYCRHKPGRSKERKE